MNLTNNSFVCQGMKPVSLLLCCLIYAGTIFCQQTELKQFNKERQRISKSGLKILTGYSVANIIYGSIASSNTSIGSAHYFHQMNAIWNGITLGFLGVGLLTAKKEGELTCASTLKKQNNIEKLFLFNAGLDLAYLAGGAYLNERSKIPANSYKLSGYGKSIMIQGGMLFIFDAVMYSLHQHHGKKLLKMAEGISLK